MRLVGIVLAVVLAALVPAAVAVAPAGPGPAQFRLAAPALPRGRGDPPARPDPAGGFVLPLGGPAVVLTPFRAPEQPYGPGHRGVDLAAAGGSPVLAAGSGTVVYAAALAGRGVVSIEHPGGLRTTYEPVTATVASGQRVIAGEVIGIVDVGHPTCAPQDCLHWGARLPDGSYLDPMSLLRPWRVRLKPWGPPP